MMTLIGALIIPLLIALIIGVATGWWAWAHHRVAIAAPIMEAPRPVEVVPVAEPVAFAKAPEIVVPTPVAMPVPTAAPVVAPVALAMTALGIPAAIGDPDDLLQLKGVGPKLNALLISLGVTRFDQIAAWGSDDVAKVDGHLGSFKGRIVREDWVEQAGLLASGQISAFEAKFGKLDSENV